MVLQSTFFRHLSLGGIAPDIVFVLLIFSSVYQGSFKAEGTGFIVGILSDLISLAPPGFNAFIFTLSAFIAGLFKGTVFFDPVLMPVIFVGVGTFFKNMLSFLLKSVFLGNQGMSFFDRTLWLEMGIHIILAPLLFGLLKAFKIIRMNERETGYGG